MNNAKEYYNKSSQDYVNKWDLSLSGLNKPTNLYRQALIEALLETADIKKDDKVVEIGCGTGLVLREALKRTAPVFGVDVSIEMLNRTRDIVLKDRQVAILDDFSQMGGQTADVFLAVDDFLNLHLPERSFDKILSLEVLRYIDDLDKAFINIRKIMREDTVFIFTLTNLWSLSLFPLKYSLRKFFGRLDEKNELLQYFVTEKSVRRKLKESGLKIIRFEKLNLLSANPLVAKIVKNKKWAEKIISMDKRFSKISIINKLYDTFLVAVKLEGDNFIHR